MLELGRMQTLEIVKEKDFGVYLGEPGKSAGGAEKGVLLPKKQVPEGAKTGDPLEVFLYKDSEDRIIATTTRPKLSLGETASAGGEGNIKDRRIPGHGAGKGSSSAL